MMQLSFLQKAKNPQIAEDESVDYIEVDTVRDEEDGSLLIRVETLDNFADTEKIQSQLRSGNIVWVKIKSLKEKDMAELKRSVDRLRKTSIAVGGDIAGIDEDFLILTPKGVVVHRG